MHQVTITAAGYPRTAQTRATLGAMLAKAIRDVRVPLAVSHWDEPTPYGVKNPDGTWDDMRTFQRGLKPTDPCMDRG